MAGGLFYVSTQKPAVVRKLEPPAQGGGVLAPPRPTETPTEAPPAVEVEAPPAPVEVEEPPVVVAPPVKPSFRDRLAKARAHLRRVPRAIQDRRGHLGRAAG